MFELLGVVFAILLIGAVLGLLLGFIFFVAISVVLA